VTLSDGQPRENACSPAVRRGCAGELGWPGGCGDQDVRCAFTKADGVVKYLAAGHNLVSELRFSGRDASPGRL